MTLRRAAVLACVVALLLGLGCTAQARGRIGSSSVPCFTSSAGGDPLATAGRGNDDTAAFESAIATTPDGGILCIPPGHFRISGTLKIIRPITLAGSGIGSQIFEQDTASTLLQFVGVNGAVVRDLYLGSAATKESTALIELNDSNHNRIDNVTMLGGYYGLHLIASILNTMIDLRSGTNLQGYSGSQFFAQNTSPNHTWVYAEGGYDAQQTYVAANANTFIAPALEGGTNGIYITDKVCAACIRGGQGSLQILGGTIEGVSDTGLTFEKTFLPSTVTGVDFEKNGTDVLVNDAANIRMTGLNSTSDLWTGRGIVMEGVIGTSGLNGYYVKNIEITDSYVDKIDIATGAPGARAIRLVNIVLDCPLSSNMYLNVPPTTSLINVACDY